MPPDTANDGGVALLLWGRLCRGWRKFRRCSGYTEICTAVSAAGSLCHKRGCSGGKTDSVARSVGKGETGGGWYASEYAGMVRLSVVMTPGWSCGDRKADGWHGCARYGCKKPGDISGLGVLSPGVPRSTDVDAESRNNGACYPLRSWLTVMRGIRQKFLWEQPSTMVYTFRVDNVRRS